MRRIPRTARTPYPARVPPERGEARRGFRRIRSERRGDPAGRRRPRGGPLYRHDAYHPAGAQARFAAGPRARDPTVAQGTATRPRPPRRRVRPAARGSPPPRAAPGLVTDGRASGAISAKSVHAPLPTGPCLYPRSMLRSHRAMRRIGHAQPGRVERCRGRDSRTNDRDAASILYFLPGLFFACCEQPTTSLGRRPNGLRRWGHEGIPRSGTPEAGASPDDPGHDHPEALSGAWRAVRRSLRAAGVHTHGGGANGPGRRSCTGTATSRSTPRRSAGSGPRAIASRRRGATPARPRPKRPRVADRAPRPDPSSRRTTPPPA